VLKYAYNCSTLSKHVADVSLSHAKDAT